MRKDGVLGITEERIKLTYRDCDDTAAETTESGHQGRPNGRANGRGGSASVTCAEQGRAWHLLQLLSGYAGL